jgi:hypothetical protein
VIARVVRISAESAETVAEGAFYEVFPVGERALVRLGGDPRLAWLDLATGALEELVDLPADTRGAHLAPDGASAWIVAGPDPAAGEDQDPYRLLRVDLKASAIAGEVTVDGSGQGNNQPYAVLPLPDGGAWMAVAMNRTEAQYRRYDNDLAVVESFTDRFLDVVARDGDLIGTDNIEGVRGNARTAETSPN